METMPWILSVQDFQILVEILRIKKTLRLNNNVAEENGRRIFVTIAK